MLGHLHIENIAIMDNVSLELESGFLALTGQTGAGKSIIIDSINLLTGERSSRELVKSGKDKALVEGAIYTDNREDRVITVPNVVGMSLSQANEVISEAGFNALFKGATQSYAGAVVGSQSPAAGEIAPVGGVVTAEMRFETAD